MTTFILPITATVAAANALLLIALALLVVHHRITNQVALGSGGSEPLERAIRTHGNLTEYAPLALILLGILEFNSLPAWQLGALGGLFTAARLSHAHGMLSATLQTRTYGAMGSVIAMLAMVGLLATRAVWG